MMYNVLSLAMVLIACLRLPRMSDGAAILWLCVDVTAYMLICATSRSSSEEA